MLHWRWEMAPCALSVLACMAAAMYVIRRYEGAGSAAGGDETQRRPGVVYDDEAWRPCFQTLHPAWLMVYRFTCTILFSTLAAIAVSSQHVLLYFYTWWTFLLVTIYFGLATGLSVYGFRKFQKGQSFDGQGDRKVAGFWGYLLQVVYQTSAGAVMLTDSVYWLIIFPHIVTRRDVPRITFWNVMPHTFNFIFLLGDAGLNSMCYPWFRIGYFMLWTSVYVVFQWTVHALSAITWWPYPFLDLSTRLAPLWYVVVGVLQAPCYLAFTAVLILKRRLFAKWFPGKFITGAAVGAMMDP